MMAADSQGTRRGHGRRARAVSNDNTAVQSAPTGEIDFSARRGAVALPEATAEVPVPRKYAGKRARRDGDLFGTDTFLAEKSRFDSQVLPAVDPNSATSEFGLPKFSGVPAAAASEPVEAPVVENGAANESSSYMLSATFRESDEPGKFSRLFGRKRKKSDDTASVDEAAIEPALPGGGIAAEYVRVRGEALDASAATNDAELSDDEATVVAEGSQAELVAAESVDIADVTGAEHSDSKNVETFEESDSEFLDVESVEVSSADPAPVAEKSDDAVESDGAYAAVADAESELDAAASADADADLGITDEEGDVEPESERAPASEGGSVWVAEASALSNATEQSARDALSPAATKAAIEAQSPALAPAQPDYSHDDDAASWLEVGDLPADQAPDPRPAPRFEGSVLNKPTRSAGGAAGWITWILVALVIATLIVLLLTGVIGPGIIHAEAPHTAPVALERFIS